MRFHFEWGYPEQRCRNRNHCSLLRFTWMLLSPISLTCMPVSRNKAKSNLYKKYFATLFVIQTDCMALPHLSSALGLSQRPWSHTLSLAGYLPLPRPRHSLQRKQLEFECDHWCITFQFQCHPILEDCKWDEGRDESSALDEIRACRVLWNSAKELETTVDRGCSVSCLPIITECSFQI